MTAPRRCPDTREERGKARAGRSDRVSRRGPRERGPRERGPRQRGITLVELMIAMVITSIIVIMLLSVQSQLTQSFRGQQIASEVNTNLRMAASTIRRDLAHAGYLLPEGEIQVAPDVRDDDLGFLRGIEVRNNAHGNGPDEIRMLFADDGKLALIDDMGPVFADVDDDENVEAELAHPQDFDEGELIMLATAEGGCLVMVSGAEGNPNHVHFNPNRGGEPFNDPGDGEEPNSHCDAVRQAVEDDEPAFIYSFVGRGYRLDPDRPEAGVLQMSRIGGLDDVDGDDLAEDSLEGWVDVGVGFTNLQAAIRYYEEDHTTDLDGSGDPERNWYSGDNLHDPPEDAVPLAVSLSLEARSRSRTGDVATPATPAFIDLENAEHNPIGDFGQECPGAALDPCGLDLANVDDSDRPPRYRGDHLYRWTTITVNLRNMHADPAPPLLPVNGDEE